jgi:hypothetical protein
MIDYLSTALVPGADVRHTVICNIGRDSRDGHPVGNSERQGLNAPFAISNYILTKRFRFCQGPDVFQFEPDFRMAGTP